MAVSAGCKRTCVKSSQSNAVFCTKRPTVVRKTQRPAPTIVVNAVKDDSSLASVSGIPAALAAACLVSKPSVLLYM